MTCPQITVGIELPNPFLKPINSCSWVANVYTLMHNPRVDPFDLFTRKRPMEATKVGIREFRSGLADYIASQTPVAVTRHGQTVGFFIPTLGQAQADRTALEKVSAELDRLLAARSVDIDEVAAEFKAARKAGRQPARKAA